MQREKTRVKDEDRERERETASQTGDAVNWDLDRVFPLISQGRPSPLCRSGCHGNCAGAEYGDTFSRHFYVG